MNKKHLQVKFDYYTHTHIRIYEHINTDVYVCRPCFSISMQKLIRPNCIPRLTEK